jgi:hypothetical protein
MARKTPYTDQIVAFVWANPGCSKLAVAKHVRRDARTNPTRLYAVVNKQIELGHVHCIYGSGRYFLYARGDKRYKDVMSQHTGLVPTE